MMPLIYAMVILSMPVFRCQIANNVAFDKCLLSLDVGHKCSSTTSDLYNNKTKLQFYYDKDTKYCLAFKYEGCGGNANRFEGFVECMQCKPVDSISCFGERLDSAGIFGRLYCWIIKGEFLKGFGGYAICCDKIAEEQFIANIHPKCSSFSADKNCRRIVKQDDEFSTTLVGKKCAHNFCPTNSTCKQLDLFAHCYY